MALFRTDIIEPTRGLSATVLAARNEQESFQLLETP
jgi:hypothetical protein